MSKFSALFAALVMSPVLMFAGSEAQSQQVIGNGPQGPICSGPLGSGPCADIQRYLQQQGSSQGNIGGLPGAGLLPQDGQIVAAIGQQCGGNPVCMAGAWGTVEIQRCRNGAFVPGGCFGPNGEIMKVLNRTLPQHLRPGTIIDNVQSDIKNGPGENNDLVGKNGFVCKTLFGGC